MTHSCRRQCLPEAQQKISMCEFRPIIASVAILFVAINVHSGSHKGLRYLNFGRALRSFYSLLSPSVSTWGTNKKNDWIGWLEIALFTFFVVGLSVHPRHRRKRNAWVQLQTVMFTVFVIAIIVHTRCWKIAMFELQLRIANIALFRKSWWLHSGWKLLFFAMFML